MQTSKPVPVVLKFGSSVLTGRQALGSVVHEIYRYVRRGRKCVVVVSAMGSDTNDRIDLAQAISPSWSEINSGRQYVGLGELESALLVSLSLFDAGVSATLLGPRDLGLKAIGDDADAEPVCLNVEQVCRTLDKVDVCVVPGFVATDSSDPSRQLLLGRGSSDLTAVFIAAELGLDTVRLLKDVDGVYDQDPHKVTDARRYETVSWPEALDIGGGLVQDKAIRFAEDRKAEIEIASVASKFETRIGAGPSYKVAPQTVRPLRVALISHGPLGQAFEDELFVSSDRFQLVAASTGEASGAMRSHAPIVQSPDQLLDFKPDVIVDTYTGNQAHPEMTNLYRRAIQDEVQVVSANLGSVMSDPLGLAHDDQGSNRALQYASCVGGAAPIIEAIREARAEGPIARIDVLLNPLANFIMGRVGLGSPPENALAAAMNRGLTPNLPIRGLAGSRMVAALRLLGLAAFDHLVPEDAVELKSDFDAMAIPAGYALPRQVRARAERIDGKVARHMGLPGLPTHRALAELRDDWVGAVVQLETGREFIATGRDGRELSALPALMADLFEAARQVDAN